MDTGWYPNNNTSNHLRKGEPHIHYTIGAIMYLRTTQYRLIYRQGLVAHLYIIVQFIQIYRFTHNNEISEKIARNLLSIFVIFLVPVFLVPVFLAPVFFVPVFLVPVFLVPVFLVPVFLVPVFLAPVFLVPVFLVPVFLVPVFLVPVFLVPVQLKLFLSLPSH